MESSHDITDEDPDDSSDESRPEAVYGRLRNLIVQGQLAPGSRIIGAEVAERLGVSRTPVHSTLQRLSQEGFLRSDGGASPRVAPLTSDDAHELMYLLGSLEGLAARWTARMEDETRQRVVDDLQARNERMVEEEESERPPAVRFFDIDAEFHSTFVEPGAGPRLLKLHRSYRPQAERYFRHYVTQRLYSLDRSLEEHREMIEAISTGNSQVAEKAVERNWRSAEQRLQRGIEVAGERGSW